MARIAWLASGLWLAAVLLTIVNELLVTQGGARPARIVFGALLIIVILVVPDGRLATIAPQVRKLASHRRPDVQEEVQP